MLSLGTPSGDKRFDAIVSRAARWHRDHHRRDRVRRERRDVRLQGAQTPREDRRRRAQRRGLARARGPRGRGVRRPALIVVNDGIGGLDEYVGTSPIPVATVHRDAGADLISMAQSGAELTLTQAQYTPFVYDLTREYPGNVPDPPLVYHPTKSDLARINARYYAVRPGRVRYRYDVTLSPSLGFDEAEHHPDTRVEWVTPGQKWVESHAQNVTATCPGRWSPRSGPTTSASRRGWTGSPRRSVPASATPSGSTTPAGRTT